MPIFKVGDVVKVPFPYVDVPVQEVRPALIISAKAVGPKEDLFWVLMITSAANRGWPGDISLEADFADAGLTAPSVIRTEKIATVEQGSAVLLGHIGTEKLAAVHARLWQTLTPAQ